jgi:hypothetical protein
MGASEKRSSARLGFFSRASDLSFRAKEETTYFIRLSGRCRSGQGGIGTAL